MLRVVLDTNVVLSGLLKPEGTPGRILAAWRAGSFRLVLSEFLLSEIATTLMRPKLHALLGWPPEKVARFVLELRALADIVEPADLAFDYPRDPDDVPVLATLIAGQADLLVTGDGDLLALSDRYPIETPARFATRL